jgi:iron complex transport system ATP-binding protein
MISIKHITYLKKSKTILKNVSLKVGKGEFHILLGANGAGKSTLLKLMASDVSPNTGEILINGKNINSSSLNELALQRAVLLQENNFAFSMKAKELCAFGRAPYYSKNSSYDCDQLVAKNIKLLDLEHLAEREYHELSGGEKQRVHLARVLTQNTGLILLDEPLNALDIKHQIKVMAVLKELSEQGRTVFAIMHDINLALSFASHISLLKEGELFFTGDIKSVVDPNIFEQAFDIAFTLGLDPELNRPQVKIKDRAV